MAQLSALGHGPAAGGSGQSSAGGRAHPHQTSLFFHVSQALRRRDGREPSARLRPQAQASDALQNQTGPDVSRVTEEEGNGCVDPQAGLLSDGHILTACPVIMFVTLFLSCCVFSCTDKPSQSSPSRCSSAWLSYILQNKLVYKRQQMSLNGLLFLKAGFFYHIPLGVHLVPSVVDVFKSSELFLCCDKGSGNRAVHRKLESKNVYDLI